MRCRHPSSFHDRKGGVFVRFEFGLGANPATVMAVLDEFRRHFN